MLTSSDTLNLSLYPKQRMCHDSQATEILYGGAAGGGKSHFIRVEAIFYATEIPGIQIYIFRRTFPELTRNYLEGPSSFHAMLRPLTSKKEVNFNQKPFPSFRFSNGSAIHLCHCQRDYDVLAYQGAEIHILVVDELTHFTEDMYTYLRGRVRVATEGEAFTLNVPKAYKDKIPFILTASNPGGVGHTWVKNEFIDNQSPLDIVPMDDDKGGFLRQYIPAKLVDNPSLNQAQYTAALSGMNSPQLVRALLDGDWNVVSGGMFDDVFSRDNNVLPRGLLPDAGWPVWRAYDYGSSRPWCVLWFTEVQDGFFCDGRYIPHGSVIVFNELYGVLKTEKGFKANQGDKATVSKQALAIMTMEIVMGIKVDFGAADPSIFAKNQDKGNKFVSFADLFKDNGITWVRAANSRVHGWSLVREMLEGTDGIPRLYFTEDVFHCLRTLPVMPRSATNNDDIDTDAEDHVVDTLRYGLASKYRPQAEDKEALEQKRLRRIREAHNFQSRYDPTYIPYDIEMEGSHRGPSSLCVGYRSTK